MIGCYMLEGARFASSGCFKSSADYCKICGEHWVFVLLVFICFILNWKID